MMVFAFDRDWTVDVNPHPQHEAIPLAWVRHLAHETDHEVWAIGNQDLKDEADIPGIEALAERYYEEGINRLGEQNEFGRYEYWPERPDRLRILAEEFPPLVADLEEREVISTAAVRTAASDGPTAATAAHSTK